jgi:hypothetical protein
MEEVDFLFKLFCFIVIDNNQQVVSLTVKIERIFEFLIEMYDFKNIDDKLNQQLSNLIIQMKSEITQSDRVEDSAESQFIHSYNNLIHKFLYLINFFKSMNSQRLKRVSCRLAYNCFFNLFETLLGKTISTFKYNMDENTEVIDSGLDFFIFRKLNQTNFFLTARTLTQSDEQRVDEFVSQVKLFNVQCH